jgi:hypothetical protein
MLSGLIGSDNKKAKVELTVSLHNTTGRRLHQTFRLKAWTTRENVRMLTADLNDGDWAAGTFATKVAHLNTATGVVSAARGMTDDLLVYAARAAFTFATTGAAPQPGNGSVEVVEAALCGCCGRKLTQPDSIARGIGPECYGKVTKGETVRAAQKAKAPKAAPVVEAAPVVAVAALRVTERTHTAPVAPVAVDGKGVPYGAGDWRGRKNYQAACRADQAPTGRLEQIRLDLQAGKCSQDADLREGSTVDIFGAPLAA